MQSIKRRFKGRTTSTIFKPFVDSMIYRTKPITTLEKFPKTIIDYTYTIYGYVAVVFTLIQEGSKVRIQNKEVLTNISGTMPLTMRSRFMNFYNFMSFVDGIEDGMLIMPRQEKNPWIDAFLKAEGLTLETELLIEDGFKRNIFPEKLAKNRNEENFAVIKAGILKHLRVYPVKPVGAFLYTCIEFDLATTDFPEMKNYNILSERYGYAKRLYYLCKKFNFDLVVGGPPLK